jgi:XTP/dITP diphosphohydrolase
LKSVVLATGNTHKKDEIRLILADIPVEILSLTDLGVTIDVVEDGESYAENALIKARAAGRATGMVAIADDSGIEVDVLGGAPGIRSARFAGYDSSDEENNLLLLSQMKDIPEEDRGARFYCAAVLVIPGGTKSGEEFICTGEWRGRIGYQPKGRHGFGYDPLFVIPEEEATAAQLGEAYKREHSHRSKAFRALAEHLKAFD